jgi:hypothetical protein
MNTTKRIKWSDLSGDQKVGRVEAYRAMRTREGFDPDVTVMRDYLRAELRKKARRERIIKAILAMRQKNTIVND